MKILWLNPVFPYPLYSGGQVRAYHLLKNLAANHQITLFSFWRPNREQGPVKELEKFCRKVVIFKGRKTWTLRNVLLAGFSRLPFAVTHFYGDQKVEKAIREELRKGKYDLVHFESFYTAPYLRTDFGVPTVLGNENIESLLYQRYVNGKKSFFLKKILSYDVQKMKRYEEAAWKKADLNIAVSEKDAEKIRRITGRRPVIVPNGVDWRFFQEFAIFKAKEDRPDLLFVGDFKYFANQDALSFLTKEIWPEIKAALPNAKLWLVGKNPSRFTERLLKKDIVIDSQIQDIRQVYAQADVFLAPMRTGSGTNIKILEAMAMALPVVTTSIGAEGIKAKKDLEILVKNKPQKFARAVIKLIKNKSQSEKIGLAAQKAVKKHYDWSRISQGLEAGYQKISHEKKSN